MRREETAASLSLLLSAQTGTEITPAQLLGTEKEEKEARLVDARKNMKSLLRRMSKAGLDAGSRKQIVKALQASASPKTRQAHSHG